MDWAAWSLRGDMGSVDNATARQLLVDYGAMVHEIARSYHRRHGQHLMHPVELDDVKAIGWGVVVEAHANYDPEPGREGARPASEASWVRQNLHWRLGEYFRHTRRHVPPVSARETTSSRALHNLPTTGERYDTPTPSGCAGYDDEEEGLTWGHPENGRAWSSPLRAGPLLFDDPVDHLHQAQRQRWLREEALPQLPLQTREIVVAVSQGTSQSQLGRELGLGTVKVHRLYWKGLRQLQKLAKAAGFYNDEVSDA